MSSFIPTNSTTSIVFRSSREEVSARSTNHSLITNGGGIETLALSRLQEFGTAKALELSRLTVVPIDSCQIRIEENHRCILDMTQSVKNLTNTIHWRPSEHPHQTNFLVPSRSVVLCLKLLK